MNKRNDEARLYAKYTIYSSQRSTNWFDLVERAVWKSGKQPAKCYLQQLCYLHLCYQLAMFPSRRKIRGQQNQRNPFRLFMHNCYLKRRRVVPILPPFYMHMRIECANWQKILASLTLINSHVQAFFLSSVLAPKVPFNPEFNFLRGHQSICKAEQTLVLIAHSCLNAF